MVVGRFEGGKFLALLASLLFIGVSASGCFGGGEAPPSSGDDGAGGEGTGEGNGTNGTDGGNESAEEVVPSVLVYEDCNVQGLQMRVPADFFDGEAPPGFELAQGDPSGQTTILEVVGLDCPTVLLGEEGDEDAQEQERTTEFRFHLEVVPPDEHENPEAVRHMLLLDSIVSNEEILDLYDEWGLWAFPGSTGLDATDAVVARSGTMTVDTPFDSFEVHSAVSAPSCQEAVVFRTYAYTGEGVTGYVDVQLDETCFLLGTGSVVFDLPGADPEDLAFWLLLTAITSGTAFHSEDGSFRVMQTYAPVEDQ